MDFPGLVNAGYACGKVRKEVETPLPTSAVMDHAGSIRGRPAPTVVLIARMGDGNGPELIPLLPLIDPVRVSFGVHQVVAPSEFLCESL